MRCRLAGRLRRRHNRVGRKRLVERGNQRVTYAQVREPVEVPITGPKLLDPVAEADRCNAGVVDSAARHACPSCKSLHDFEVMNRLSQQPAARMQRPTAHRIESKRKRRTLLAEGWAGYDRNELVNAGPRDRPAARRRRRALDCGLGTSAHRHIHAMRIDQQIGIDCNHFCVMPASTKPKRFIHQSGSSLGNVGPADISLCTRSTASLDSGFFVEP